MADDAAAGATAALQQALTLYKSGDLTKAEQAARSAVIASPNSAEAWNLLGVILRTANRPQESLPCYRRALQGSPKHPAAWTNLGNAYKDIGRTEMAISCHRRAIAVQPDSGELHHNLGIALMAARRYEDAVAAYSRALLLNPKLDDVRWDRSLALLGAGRWAEGWLDYGARIGGPGLPLRDLPGSEWRGEINRRATLLVASEQGIGDAIWCWRYLPMVRARVGRLVLECRRELVELARAQGFADEVIAYGDPLPKADAHIFQCSIPGYFTTTVPEIPPAPYLTVPSGRTAKLAPLIAAGEGLRIGIVWSGSPTFKANAERSAPLWRFIECFGLAGVTLFSLQFGPRRQELETPREVPVIDLTPHLDSFADTAAAVAELDLIVMTDSAVAHLCGALGRPVWVLLPFNAYWLWGHAETTPWYPSVRLFRQRARSDWPGVFDAAGAAMVERLATP
ncbi:MAG: tetratricopeptide repeat-containing glycosyltransferase family protein [Pseudolabrys sp.]